MKLYPLSRQDLHDPARAAAKLEAVVSADGMVLASNVRSPRDAPLGDTAPGTGGAPVLSEEASAAAATPRRPARRVRIPWSPQ